MSQLSEYDADIKNILEDSPYQCQGGTPRIMWDKGGQYRRTSWKRQQKAES